VERLEMVIEVRGINEQKLFKIDRLNLKVKAKKWFKKFVIVPSNWLVMKATMFLKYGTVGKEKVKAKLDQIKQEPRQKKCKLTMIEWKCFSR
jgi:hypothetical protein